MVQRLIALIAGYDVGGYVAGVNYIDYRGSKSYFSTTKN